MRADGPADDEVAALCHDLGTPMAAIRLRLGLVVEEDGLAPAIRSELDKMLADVDRCLTILRRHRSG